ncbi:hypothetical protein H6504_00895 [Candidatus Woesearchaeota archaeon]|nr:hypothetical protein [Candidatus Woesearchaeota archaeon]
MRNQRTLDDLGASLGYFLRVDAGKERFNSRHCLNAIVADALHQGRLDFDGEFHIRIAHLRSYETRALNALVDADTIELGAALESIHYQEGPEALAHAGLLINQTPAALQNLGIFLNNYSRSPTYEKALARVSDPTNFPDIFATPDKQNQLQNYEAAFDYLKKVPIHESVLDGIKYSFSEQNI